MKTYVVGGAVRDRLLGEPVNDRDWVVVGVSPQDMLDAGYLPVGKDFPVFLHPQTHEEYALARTERKTAPGYHGFAIHAAPDVTLEQDLQRRDLTVNAIAQAEDGTLVDPYGGQADLAARVLRHVSPAFAEDPVRILRLARFAARWPDFGVAPETMALMRGMVAAGEVDALVAERVWQELSRGLMERAPGRMLEVLRDVGALARLLPEVDRLFGVPQPPQHHPEIDTGVHTLMVLARCALAAQPLPVRWACLVHDLGKGTTPADVLPRHIGHEARGEALIREVNQRLRVPNDCGELALLTAREHTNVHASTQLGATALMRLLERCDALRRPERFLQMLAACECDARGRLGLEERPYPQRARLERALEVVQEVDARAVSAHAIELGLKGPAIADAIRKARIAALAATFSSDPGEDAPDHRMKLPANETALVVIDVQAALFDPPPADAEDVIARINALATRARAAGVPVVWVQHEREGGDLQADSPGWQLHADLHLDDADLRVRKKMSDAFLHTPLQSLLAERGVRHLTVCGYSSEFCVDSTVRAAAARGYAVTLAADAHTSHDKPHATGLQIRTHENETLRNISSYYVEIDAVPAAQIAFG